MCTVRLVHLMLLVPLSWSMGCSSCGGLFEDEFEQEKRELCESTDGAVSKTFGCGQAYDDGIQCSAQPNCPEGASERIPRYLHCECPPGELFDDGRGCQPSPDPACRYAETVQEFEAHALTIAEDMAIDCGHQRTGGVIRAEIHQCLVDAQTTSTPAFAIFSDDIFRSQVLILGESGALLHMSYYDRADHYSVERYRCAPPISSDPMSPAASLSDVFACDKLLF